MTYVCRFVDHVPNFPGSLSVNASVLRPQDAASLFVEDVRRLGHYVGDFNRVIVSDGETERTYVVRSRPVLKYEVEEE